MRKNISDGWHTICGFNVYVENGIVKKGELEDYNGIHYTAWPYRLSKQGGWDNVAGFITVDSFRYGVKRGTVMLF